MAAAEINPVAIYAAALSTAVAAWNFYQWWSRGPKLFGSISSNMSVLGGIQADKNIYVVMTVSNRGDSATTVTNLGLLKYSSRWSYFRGKCTQTAFIGPSGGLGSPTPFQLSPGGEFRGFAIQNTELEQWSQDHLLFMCVWHTMSNKPFKARLRPIARANGRSNV